MSDTLDIETILERSLFILPVPHDNAVRELFLSRCVQLQVLHVLDAFSGLYGTFV